MTAVEWFLENLRNLIKESELTDMRPNEFDAREMKLLKQAKEMEKYQRQEDTNYGYSQGWDDGNQNKEPMRPELKQQDNEDNNKISN